VYIKKTPADHKAINAFYVYFFPHCMKEGLMAKEASKMCKTPNPINSLKAFSIGLVEL
jgi:hypothetical protein